MNVDIIAFGAHPDDVEIGCGGTLARTASKGYKVGIIDLTRGERGTKGTKETRETESANSSKILSLAVRENLDIPDTMVSTSIEFRSRVIKALRTYRPKTVILPANDHRHPDHTAAERLVFESCYLSGLVNYDAPLDAFRPSKILKIHHHRQQHKPTFVVDITDFLETKLKAIEAYSSQFPREDKTQVGLQKLGDVREWITSRARYYGMLVGKKYGEGFIQDEMMLVDDITKLDVPTI